jgi:hypothetical protein
MNLLLTVIGQSLNHPGRLRDPQQRVKMQNVLPTANLRFHEALDRMEEDIVMAQNIMKRDLALHRVMVKRKAEEALKPPEPPKKVKPDGLVKKEPDVVMKDAPVENKSPTKKAPEVKAPPQPQAAPAKTRIMEPVQPKKEVVPPKPKPTPQPAPVAPMAPMVAPQAPVQAPIVPPSVPAESIPAPKKEPEPEPEPEPPGDLNDLDFSEFFGDDLAEVQAGDDAPMGNDNPVDLGDFGNADADVSSLLPGLGEYANIPDDTAMPDLPPSSAPENAQSNDALPEFDFVNLAAAQPADDTQSQQENTNTQQTVQDFGAQPDFGDLDFNFDAGGSGGNGAGGQGGGNGDNTFNDLFDMDQYDFGGGDLGGGGNGGGGGGGGDDINDWMKSL